jgi:hypothetical protein
MTIPSKKLSILDKWELSLSYTLLQRLLNQSLALIKRYNVFLSSSILYLSIRLQNLLHFFFKPFLHGMESRFVNLIK